MNALFVNLPTQACGVADFGRRLFDVLSPSERICWHYQEPEGRDRIGGIGEEVIVYNWIDGQGGYLSEAPFVELNCKQVLVYHDGTYRDGFDAILFADPTMTNQGIWHSIGRPLAHPQVELKIDRPHPIIGVHGFRGAYADRVVEQTLKDFAHATVRMQLPFSHYCDPGGGEAIGMADKCRAMVAGTNIHLDISHTFLTERELLWWLAENTINCYLRDPQWVWRGVSSAPDYGLSVNRPVAVSRCNAFRHLHHTVPSICVEYQTLPQIIANGMKPILPLIEQWSPVLVCDQVDDIILGLQGK